MVRKTHINGFLMAVLPSLLLLAGCRTAPWDKLSPQYTSQTAPQAYKFRNLYPSMRSIWTSDGKRLWAVGDGGMIIESGDGEHWTPRNSGTSHLLYSIFGTRDGERLWAVGDGGTIVESTDGGEQWTLRNSSTLYPLFSVFGTSEGRNVWAVGYTGTILKSTDGGEHWTPRSSGTSNWLRSIFGTNDGKRLWVVGEDGTMLESTDSGEHWTPRNSLTANGLISIFGTSDGKRLWAVGERGAIVESTDGNYWNPRDSGTSNPLYSIFVTSDGKRLWAVGVGGTIVESTDGGEHWTPRNSGTSYPFYSISGTSDGKYLWAVGEDGAIAESTDGEHWSPRNSGPPYLFRSIFGTDDGKRLWAVGGGGMLAESADGEHWSRRNSGTKNGLVSIFRTNDGKRLWAVGGRGTIVESTDGEHWTSRDGGTSIQLYSICGTSDGERLWAVGDGGTIVGSTDGKHWTPRNSGTSNSLYSIFVTSDGKRLWAVGDRGMIMESTDGEHWTPRNSGTPNLLDSIFGTSDGKRLWAVGDKGTIVASTDGEHWVPQDSGTTNWLVSISGTSDGKVWVVGTNGTILESTDGEHWALRNSGTAASLLGIFGTSDGKRLWMVGETVLVGELQGTVPFVSKAHMTQVPFTASLNLQLEKSTSGQRPLEVAAYGRNEYDAQHNFVWRKGFLCRVQNDETGVWECSFQPSALDLQANQKAHFLIHIQYEGGTDTYEFTTVYDPWAVLREHSGWTGLAAVVLIMTVFPAVLLFVRPLWNLGIYRFLKLNQIEKLDLPAVGGLVQIVLRLVTVLPWFVKRPRTLDAWIEKHRRAVRVAWQTEVGPTTFGYSDSDSNSDPDSGSEIYVPLPIRIGNPISGALAERPCSGDIGRLVTRTRSTMQIVGPGGAGKTTLARQIGEWAFKSGLGIGLSDHPMLPVWIDEELDGEKSTLPAVVKGRLIAALPDDEIEDVLFSALLEKQRLLVFVDRVSERSPGMQRYIETIYRSTRIGCLVVTSRTSVAIDGSQSIYIYPQPLNSTTLLRFMTDLLAVFLADARNREPANPQASSSVPLSNLGAEPFSRMEDQLKLGGRLAALIRLSTEKGEEDAPLVPLPVRIFVEEAVRLLRNGTGLDQLPRSLPEVYFRHLRQVNPRDPSAQHFLDGDRMLRIAKILGKVAVGKDYIPKEFSRNDALAALKAAGEGVSASSDPLMRLKMNGVLVEKPRGIDSQLRFALDPVAEFLAAAARVEECGAHGDEWNKLLLQSVQAPGFHMALQLSQEAYARDKESADHTSTKTSGSG